MPSAPSVSPVMQRLSAYIAGALRKPLPAAVAEKPEPDGSRPGRQRCALHARSIGQPGNEYAPIGHCHGPIFGLLVCEPLVIGLDNTHPLLQGQSTRLPLIFFTLSVPTSHRGNHADFRKLDLNLLRHAKAGESYRWTFPDKPVLRIHYDTL